MRVVLSIILFFGIFMTVFPAYAAVKVEFFHSEHCAECRSILEESVEPVMAQFGEKAVLLKLETTDEQNFMRLSARLDAIGDQSNYPAYILVGEKIVLRGRKEIADGLKPAIESCLESGIAEAAMPAADSEFLKRRMTVAAVCVAGLLDGINPCVFSALIFLISLMGATASGKKQLAVIGFSYIAGCFTTYLLLGAGFSWLLAMAARFVILGRVVNYGLGLLLAVCGIAALIDALRYKLDASPKSLLVKLPGRLTDFIHRSMKDVRSRGFAAAAVFLLSIPVTLAESICTGQIYLPTLQLLMREGGSISRWGGLLLLYNIMFILPLAAVFILAMHGLSYWRLLRISRKSFSFGKAAAGAFMLAMAVFLIFYK